MKGKIEIAGIGKCNFYWVAVQKITHIMITQEAYTDL